MKHLLLALACVAACTTDQGAGAPLPRPTAFAFDVYPTQADCDAAKQNGEFPTVGTCQNQLLFCPDGSVTRYMGDILERGEYRVAGEEFELTFSDSLSIEDLVGSRDGSGDLRLHGSGEDVGQLWRRLEVAQVTVATCD